MPNANAPAGPGRPIVERKDAVDAQEQTNELARVRRTDALSTAPNEAPVVWLLVADEAIAHLYELPIDGGDLVPVEQITDPAAHRTTVEQRRDALGRRGGDDVRMGGNATESAGLEAEVLEAGRFAKQVAQLLAQRLQQRRFDELHVAAAPRFLGHLRKALDKAVTGALGRQIDKDLIHETAAELTARLFPERLPRKDGKAS